PPFIPHHCSSFFFQAEDGIRDRNVTGVQTCALPIFCPVQSQIFSLKNLCLHADPVIMCLDCSLSRVKSITFALRVLGSGLLMARSEERRVGKECGCARGEGNGREMKRDETA